MTCFEHLLSDRVDIIIRMQLLLGSIRRLPSNTATEKLNSEVALYGTT